MFSADCYLSVISAFLSVMMTEPSRGGRVKQQNEKKEEEDVWTAIKRTTNRKCKSADAPAVVFGLAAAAATVKSKQHE